MDLDEMMPDRIKRWAMTLTIVINSAALGYNIYARSWLSVTIVLVAISIIGIASRYIMPDFPSPLQLRAYTDGEGTISVQQVEYLDLNQPVFFLISEGNDIVSPKPLPCYECGEQLHRLTEEHIRTPTRFRLRCSTCQQKIEMLDGMDSA